MGCLNELSASSRTLQCCLGTRMLLEEAGTTCRQLEKQRKSAITEITRRNSIKAPGQVCEEGVTDTRDSEINRVGHSEAVPTCIGHNAPFSIRRCLSGVYSHRSWELFSFKCWEFCFSHGVSNGAFSWGKEKYSHAQSWAHIKMWLVCSLLVSRTI